MNGPMNGSESPDNLSQTLINPLVRVAMAAECNDASPVSFTAELAGLARDTVFQLCGASLEANARLINPRLAGIG